MSPWLLILIPAAILTLILGIYGFHRLLLWMERKEWIYYRKVRPMNGVRGSMSMFQQIVEPEVRHVIEAKDQQKATVDERDPSDR